MTPLLCQHLNKIITIFPLAGLSIRSAKSEGVLRFTDYGRARPAENQRAQIHINETLFSYLLLFFLLTNVAMIKRRITMLMETN